MSAPSVPPEREVESNTRTAAFERASMWLVRVAFVSLVVVVGWNFWTATIERGRAHAIRCDKPVYDFGIRYSGEHVQNTYQLINLSKEPLTVEGVKLECGCTTVSQDLKGKVIAPNEMLSVPLDLSLDKLDGKIVRRAFINFAGDPILRIKLQIKGEVHKRWSWSPETVILNKDSSGEGSALLTIVRHPMLQAGTIESVSTTNGSLIDATLETRPPGSGDGVFVVKIRSAQAIRTGGRQRAEIYLTESGVAESENATRLVGPISVSIFTAEAGK